MSKSNNERPFNRIYQPDDTNVTESETPLTDAEMSDGWSGDAFAVSVEFSRKLELKLAAKEAELAEFLERSSKTISIILNELEESRAQVARLRDSLYALVTYPEAFKSLAEIAKKELVRGDKT